MPFRPGWIGNPSYENARSTTTNRGRVVSGPSGSCRARKKRRTASPRRSERCGKPHYCTCRQGLTLRNLDLEPIFGLRRLPFVHCYPTTRRKPRQTKETIVCGHGFWHVAAFAKMRAQGKRPHSGECGCACWSAKGAAARRAPFCGHPASAGWPGWDAATASEARRSASRRGSVPAVAACSNGLGSWRTSACSARTDSAPAGSWRTPVVPHTPGTIRRATHDDCGRKCGSLP